MPDNGNYPPDPYGLRELDCPQEGCQDSPIRLAAIDHAPNCASSPDIYWSLDHLAADSPDQLALPPPEIFNKIFNNVSLSLQQQAQRRASHSIDTPAPEPLLALYCPIEGGDYIIDSTVRELARRSNADVVVLDAIHIAAEGWGRYGPGTAQPSFLLDHIEPFLSGCSPELSEGESHTSTEA
jgi:hypothetical protein